MLQMLQLLWHNLPFSKSTPARIIVSLPAAHPHPLGPTAKNIPFLIPRNTSTIETVGTNMTHQQACTMTQALAIIGTV
ncbi:unnamed protein product [Callosobruchus maculatus]|uniref:Uncharacterized protein n=1 Tax=Callosobruchus maculatus TaxID=64391 RepID=A0A653BUV3_CALMS|nr:unnamed protein product [Callosobruchus maculatus]